MDIYGIRILDEKNDIISVMLKDILELIDNGQKFYWAIFLLETTWLLTKDQIIPLSEEKVKKEKNGLLISWDELNLLAKKIYQEINIVVVGCKNKENLHHYDDDKEMCQKCDFVILMIDTSYWEVFTLSKNFLMKCQKKFKQTELLDKIEPFNV